MLAALVPTKLQLVEDFWGFLRPGWPCVLPERGELVPQVVDLKTLPPPSGSGSQLYLHLNIPSDT